MLGDDVKGDQNVVIQFTKRDLGVILDSHERDLKGFQT